MKKGSLAPLPTLYLNGAIQAHDKAAEIVQRSLSDAKAEFKSAIFGFKNFLEIDKDASGSSLHSKVYFRMTKCMHQLGSILQLEANKRFEESKDHADFMKKTRKNIDTYLQKGVTLMEEKVEEGLKGDLVIYYADLALAYMLVEDFENAKLYYEKAIPILKAAPKSPDQEVSLRECRRKHDEACRRIALKYNITATRNGIEEAIASCQRAEQAIKAVYDKEKCDFLMLIDIFNTISTLYAKKPDNNAKLEYISNAIKLIEKRIPKNERTQQHVNILKLKQHINDPENKSTVAESDLHTINIVSLQEASPDVRFLEAVLRNEEKNVAILLKDNTFSNDTIYKALLLAIDKNLPSTLNQLFNHSKLTIADFTEKLKNTDDLAVKKSIVALMAFFYLRRQSLKDPEDPQQIIRKAYAIQNAIFSLNPEFNNPKTSKDKVLLDSPSPGTEKMAVSLQDLHKPILFVVAKKTPDDNLKKVIQDNLYASIKQAEESKRAKREEQRVDDLRFSQSHFEIARREYHSDLNNENKENPESSRLKLINAQLDSLDTLITTIEQKNNQDVQTELTSLKNSLIRFKLEFDQLKTKHKSLGANFEGQRLKIESRSAVSSDLKNICEDYNSYKEALTRYEQALPSVAERLKAIDVTTKQQVSVSRTEQVLSMTASQTSPPEQASGVGTLVLRDEPNAVPETKLVQTQAQRANADEEKAKVNFAYLKAITDDRAYFPQNLLYLTKSISELCSNILLCVERDLAHIRSRNRHFFKSPALSNFQKQQLYCQNLIKNRLPEVRRLYSEFSPNFQLVKTNISVITKENLPQHISLLKNMKTLFQKSYLKDYMVVKAELETIKAELQAMDYSLQDWSADLASMAKKICAP